MTIEDLKYDPSLEEGLREDPFYNGPGEFLVREIAKELAANEDFKTVFGDSIYSYRRMDFSIRELPGIRIYNETGTKDFESWFVEGTVKVDIIFPGDIRREETQQFQDSVSAAVLQQFRRPAFFTTLEASVPGLNELGKRVEWDKSLGFEWNETVVPLTQIVLNFRLDLRVWDNYLESTNRTKDSPFREVIGDLKRLVTTIDALRSDTEKEVSIGSDQRPGVPPEEGE
jgi:hypothetical protein